MTVAKITRVTGSEGLLGDNWDFSFVLTKADEIIFEGSVTLYEAEFFGKPDDSSPVAEMCRIIRATPVSEFSWLVGRAFSGKDHDNSNRRLPAVSI